MSTSEHRSSGRDRVRTGVVWDAVQGRLDAGARVVDIGGGTGGFAVRLAEHGHPVTVVDPSPDALAALDRRADEAGVADLVTGVQGDLADLEALVVDGVEPDLADVVLCHGVLEVVPHPVAALRTIADLLRPGGLLSLLVAQRHAAVVARAMAGHFQQALTLLDDTRPDDTRPDDTRPDDTRPDDTRPDDTRPDDTRPDHTRPDHTRPDHTRPDDTRPDHTRLDHTRPDDTGHRSAGGRAHRYTADEVVDLLIGAGFTIDTVQAVRVFADLVPGSLLDLEPGATAALVELERAVAGRPEYLPLATQVHLLATR